MSAINTSPKYLSAKQLAERYGVLRGCIWRWVSIGKFPKPHKFGPRTVRWFVADIEQWEAQRGANV